MSEISSCLELSQRARASVVLVTTGEEEHDNASKHVYEYLTQLLRYSQFVIWRILLCRMHTYKLMHALSVSKQLRHLDALSAQTRV
ncbi:hypothetical protein T07_4182 [Trichinella nelsoni]|uniref:Uncharacterized protein n=1 Tax=Trichinella nelsoni TaxID=6336 RepID=A0A0V0RH84_9BILA|nr:hypothetical protein T07_4182 [Trichinella nelsoni]